MFIHNSFGRQINFEAAVNLMDDTLREQLAAEGIEDDQEFFAAYCEAHARTFGAVFALDAANPQY